MFRRPRNRCDYTRLTNRVRKLLILVLALYLCSRLPAFYQQLAFDVMKGYS